MNRPSFSNNKIAYLREEKELSQSQLEELVGIKRENISRWERSVIIPNAVFCWLLADYFEVSVDFLIGRKDFESEKVERSMVGNPSISSNRIAFLREKKGVSQCQVEKFLDIKQVNISRWERGLITPNVIDCWVLADFFDVSVDYLIGREKE